MCWFWMVNPRAWGKMLSSDPSKEVRWRDWECNMGGEVSMCVASTCAASWLGLVRWVGRLNGARIFFINVGGIVVCGGERACCITPQTMLDKVH